MREWVKVREKSAQEVLNALYNLSITSVLVEGGPKTHGLFVQENLWDEARITKAKIHLNSGVQSIPLKGMIKKSFNCGKSNEVSIISPISL
jgi:diaminohydroxyphosphoribosylaminopyrimidine deaminase/5-amino-6-(5-phosphoribosylamino)uracil reductase